jgi:penicillin-binding protein 1A
MDDKYSKEHDRIVLEEFEKIKKDFSMQKASREEEDAPLSLEDLFAEEGEDVPADAIDDRNTQSGRRSRRQAQKSEASGLPIGVRAAAYARAVRSNAVQTWQRIRAAGTKKTAVEADRKEELAAEGAAPMDKKQGFRFGRKAPKSRTKQKKFRINWKKFLRFAAIIAGVGVLAVGVVAFMAIKDAPAINPDNIYDLLSENSVIYDTEGNIVDNVYKGDALRTNIEYQQLPQDLIDAFISIEDKTFEKHNGFNIIRIFGAIWESIKTGDKISGTSTITQQLARNLYLTDTKSERSMVRKIREAYYTVILERGLSKEQILEAYLNTIYLGFNSNGVQAASQAYFSKDVESLTLVECALLAALPQSPSYAPIKRIATEDVEDFEVLDIIEKNDEWTTYYNPSGERRLQTVLYFMHDLGKLTDEEYETAKATPIRDSINPGTGVITANSASFFSDYVVEQVIRDLSQEFGIDEEEAVDLVYNGGLQIHSTLSSDLQNIVEEEFAKNGNFPAIGYATKDRKGNILDSEGNVLLYSRETFFDAEGDFILEDKEFKWNDDGSLTVYKGNRLNIYKTNVQGKTDYSVEFKNLYEVKDGILYSRAGGVWLIPAEYKDRDSSGNLLISAQYFADKPEAFTKNENGTLTLGSEYYSLKQSIVQPQSAMVIMDYETGQMKALIGGRSIQGRMLFNRATSARQPGSSIKPLSVYSVALQSAVDGTGDWTAASPIDDAPIKYGGAAWPKNWYAGYTGINTLRRAVEQSINACAVNLWMQLDPQMSVDFLTNMGVTTLVEYGEVNDINAAALALGGMTKGISALEMTAAYGTFGNGGTYIEPICYTTVTNRNGDILLEKTPISHKVMDESVASLMTNILETTVNNGIAGAAKIAAQPVAGKTGTTSERYDVWFCGLTPQYSAALWIGNDVNIPMNQGSGAAASLWSRIMQRVCADLPREEFQMRGDFVTATVDRMSGKLPSSLSAADPRGTLISDIFIQGTVPTEYDDAHVLVNVCADTGYLATPYCSNSVSKLAVIRPNGSSWEKTLVDYSMSTMGLRSLPDAIYDAPEFYCPVHNPNPAMYPISPFAPEKEDENPFYVDPSGNVVTEGAINTPEEEEPAEETYNGNDVPEPTPEEQEDEDN